ncbi:MAG TPA: four helix bundle protein [Epulopiscium sp.]|nr:four helix bundle protein [Candidatus Epulonipiscium sp.]
MKIQFKDVQNLDIAKELKANIGLTYKLLENVKNRSLKDQIQRSSLSCMTNFTRGISNVAKPVACVNSYFIAYGSARETYAWLMLLTKFKIIPLNEIEPLANYYLELCYKLIKLINNAICENNIKWSDIPTAKIFYQDSHRLNVYVKLQELTIDVYNLAQALSVTSFGDQLISHSTSALLNIEEGLAFKQYQPKQYVKFLKDSLQQIYSTLADLETFKSIAKADNKMDIDYNKIDFLIYEYTGAAKVVCTLINKNS